MLSKCNNSCLLFHLEISLKNGFQTTKNSSSRVKPRTGYTLHGACYRGCTRNSEFKAMKYILSYWPYSEVLALFRGNVSSKEYDALSINTRFLLNNNLTVIL